MVKKYHKYIFFVSCRMYSKSKSLDICLFQDISPSPPPRFYDIDLFEIGCAIQLSPLPYHFCLTENKIFLTSMYCLCRVWCQINMFRHISTIYCHRIAVCPYVCDLILLSTNSLKCLQLKNVTIIYIISVANLPFSNHI